MAMDKPATRDELLEQIRRLPLEDRDYIAAELLKDAYEAGRCVEDPALIAELARRADETPARPDAGLSREAAVAQARAAVDAVRAQRP